MTFRFLAPAEAELLEGIAYDAAIRGKLGIRLKEAVTVHTASAACRRAALVNTFCAFSENDYLAILTSLMSINSPAPTTASRST